MNADTPLERRIAGFLVAETPVRAPDRVLESALARVGDIRQRRSPAARLRREWVAMTARRRLALALLSVLAVAGAVAVGALLLRSAPRVEEPVSLILVRRPIAVGDPAAPVSVVSIDQGGAVTDLATLQTSQLGGTYSEWYAALSPDGHLALPITLEGGASAPAVVDLRAPGEPAQHPDAEGSFPVFGPDGRLAMGINAGGFAVFDPLSATTAITSISSGVGTVQIGFSPVWAASGQGFVARMASMGTVDLSGTFTPGLGLGYYGGTGPRRVDTAGRWLQCSPGDDAGCNLDDGPLFAVGATGTSGPPVWFEDDPNVRIADFAWAVDGGIWVLLESLGPGSREITLRKIAPDGTDATIATLQGAADDPDPNSYFQGAVFAALAPGDRRVVVQVLGANGSSGSLWMIEPDGAVTTRLPDGTVAGWMGPTTLTSPRPSVVQLIETDPAIRGDWSDGVTAIDIGRTGLSMGAGRVSGPRFEVSATGPDTITIGGATSDPACTVSQQGVYRWAVTASNLRLDPIDDSCPARAAVLGSTLERALPYPDTGQVMLLGGSKYLVPDMAVPFRITIPDSAPSRVTGHAQDVIRLWTGESDADGVEVAVIAPTGRSSEPCQRRSTPVTLAGGLDGAVTYLASLTPTVTMADQGPTTIAGTPARSFTVEADASCEGLALFAVRGAGRAEHTGTGARVYLLEPIEDRLVVVSVRFLGDPTPRSEAWAQELLAAIDFGVGRR